jgi:PAS domain S-box-containing protein
MEQRRKDAEGERMTKHSGNVPPRSPDLLQALLDNAPAGMAIAGADGKILLANTKMQTITGGSIADFTQGIECGCKLLNPDGTPLSPSEFPLTRALGQGEETVGVEILARRKDGSESWILASASPLRESSGAITGAVTVFQDITERKKIEQDLQSSREQLDIAQSVGHVGMIEWDPATNTGTMSPEIRAFLGLPPDNLIDIEFWSRVTPMEDIRKALKTLDEAAECHLGEAEAQYRVIRPSGEVRWLSVRGKIYYDASGKAVRVIGSAIDITDLKKAQEELHTMNEELSCMVDERTANLEQAARSLKRQKELLQAIIDRIPVIVTVWRTPRELIMVNREFERLSGWSREEATHMDVLAASFPDPAYREEIIRAVTNARPGWGEFTWTNRSGRNIITSWAAVDLSDGTRVGIGIDVTEQRKMEKDMLRLGAAIDQAGEGIVQFSSDWIIEYVNPAYEKMTGYSREELVGKSVHFLASHNVNPFYHEAPHQVASRGEAWSGDIRWKRRTGEPIDIRVTVSPVRNSDGEIINYFTVARDITEEVRLQQMVIQSQKMEAIGSLAGGIAHDLKNIFTPILINSELALEDVDKDSPARPVLEEILSAAKVGGDLVKQIMTFARRTPGKKIPADVSSLVDETLSLLRSTIPTTIDIRHHYGRGDMEVLADPTQIRQVLMNLGSNAAYAMMERGGLLEVDVSCVDLDRDAALRASPDLAPGPYVEIEVSDTGQGMDEETQLHIFEPFFTTKSYGEGTGLGLAVVQGIVKGHQGAVSVWSRPGSGSAFRVLLPRIEKGCVGKGERNARP